MGTENGIVKDFLEPVEFKDDLLSKMPLPKLDNQPHEDITRRAVLWATSVYKSVFDAYKELQWEWHPASVAPKPTPEQPTTNDYSRKVEVQLKNGQVRTDMFDYRTNDWAFSSDEALRWRELPPLKDIYISPGGST